MATQDIGLGAPTHDTPQLWEDSLGVTPSEAEIGECLAEEFTTSFQINGHTLTAANYIELRGKAGARHDGRHHAKSGAGNARFNHAGAQATVRPGDEYCRLAWMEVLGPGNNNFACVSIDSIAATGSAIYVHHNILHNDNASTGTSQEGVLCSDVDAVWHAYRNIGFGVGASGGNLSNGAAGSTHYNNTWYDCNHSNSASRGGIGTSDTDFAVENNACFANSNLDIRNAAGTLDYNATGDTTGDDEGANGIANLTAADQFVNPTSTFADLDLLLKAGAALLSEGHDLSGTGLPEIDVGIRGNTVSGAWDIGADQADEAGVGFPVAPSPVPYHATYLRM